MTAEAHFVQGGDGPVLIGAGGETLACSCGHPLIAGFDARRFLAISVQCAQCGSVTTTAPLPEGEVPPRSAIVAAVSGEKRAGAMTVPAEVSVVGQAEMGRLQALFQPASPDWVYPVSPALSDEAEGVFARHTGDALDAVAADHALGAAVRHLRGQSELRPGF